MRIRRAISVYVLVAYAMSWAVFILLALNRHSFIHLFPAGASNTNIENAWHSLGALGPLAGAIVALFIFLDRRKRKQFWQGYSFANLNVNGWLLAFSPLLLFGICLLAGRVIHQEWFNIPAFINSNKLNDPKVLAGWLLPIILYGFGEEAGWRGYLLPQLQSKNNALMATVILSIIWVVWHIPAFFYRYDFKGGAYLGFTLGVFAGAVFLTFLFNYTKGSILAVSLWHFSFNLVSMIVKHDVVLSAVISALVMVLAGIILVKCNLEDLSPFRRVSFNGAGVGKDEATRTTVTALKNMKVQEFKH
ncbi:MAG: CPBP family intramembrane glutamic endopeptidase [Candidatus Dadabacteria bacterium]